MQYAFVQSMLRGIDALDKESSLRGLTDYPAEDEGAFWPCRHIECGRHGNGFEDQMTGSTRATDVQLYATSLYNQLRKSESCCAPGSEFDGRAGRALPLSELRNREGFGERP